jgi:glycosyltransferase involved in cell wall biosynthesis
MTDSSLTIAPSRQDEATKMSAEGTSPVVSVMMLTYNHAPYIAQAIESVLAQQTQYAFELVIGEDHSTDGTRDIVFDYQRRYPGRVRVIASDSNVGVKRNAYRTLKACRGRYIALCEGDDFWHAPNKLEMQVSFLENNPAYGMVHSGYDVLCVQTGTTIRDYLTNRGFKVPDAPSLVDIIRECRSTFRIQTCTALVRRDLYVALVDADPVLFQSERFKMGDTQLWAELSTVSRVGFIRDSLATYRLLPESASRSLSYEKALQFELSHADMILYLCDKHQVPADVKSLALESWCSTALRLAFHTRDRSLAMQAKSLKSHLSLKDRLFLLGTMNKTASSLLLAATQLRDRLSRKPVTA